MNEETALIKIESLDIAKLFTEDGMAEILKKIKTRVEELLPVSDIETESGRNEIKSVAYKVARTKTLIDDIGKQRVADIKKQLDENNKYRKYARDTLDGLKNHVRKPLTEWEAEQEKIRQEKIMAEEERVEKIKGWIEEIHAKILDTTGKTSSEILNIIDEIKSIPLTEDAFMEFLPEAQRVHAETMESLTKAYHDRFSWEEEQAAAKAEAERLEKLRQEQEEAQAKIDAENARIAEEQKKIQAEKDRIEEQKRLEQAKKEAAEKALKDAEEKRAREEREKEERLKAEEAEKKRKAALLPDQEKLYQWVEWVLDKNNIPRPELQNEDAKVILADALLSIESCMMDIRKRIDIL